MSSSELSDVAWDLVEHCRAALSIPELNTAFVRLGVGDYSEVFPSVIGPQEAGRDIRLSVTYDF